MQSDPNMVSLKYFSHGLMDEIRRNIAIDNRNKSIKVVSAAVASAGSAGIASRLGLVSGPDRIPTATLISAMDASGLFRGASFTPGVECDFSLKVVHLLLKVKAGSCLPDTVSLSRFVELLGDQHARAEASRGASRRRNKAKKPAVSKRSAAKKETKKVRKARAVVPEPANAGSEVRPTVDATALVESAAMLAAADFGVVAGLSFNTNGPAGVESARRRFMSPAVAPPSPPRFMAGASAMATATAAPAVAIPDDSSSSATGEPLTLQREQLFAGSSYSTSPSTAAVAVSPHAPLPRLPLSLSRPTLATLEAAALLMETHRTVADRKRLAAIDDANPTPKRPRYAPGSVAAASAGTGAAPGSGFGHPFPHLAPPMEAAARGKAGNQGEASAFPWRTTPSVMSSSLSSRSSSPEAPSLFSGSTTAGAEAGLESLPLFMGEADLFLQTPADTVDLYGGYLGLAPEPAFGSAGAPHDILDSLPGASLLSGSPPSFGVSAFASFSH